jgi:GNAT superfamily N-acetyltransferase
MSYRLRQATLDDQPALDALIARSARELSAGDYPPEVVEGALRGAFGVDTQLIRDGTYFVVELDGAVIGCGGWSYRRTLFGSDSGPGRDASELDPSVDAAKIRAFFIDPAHARRGLGTLLLNHCESEAGARGFTRFEMMATLPGQKLYAVRGYAPTGRITHELAPGLSIEFVPMRKELTVTHG